MKLYTMAQAKDDFERGLLKGVAIHCHVMGGVHYTVSIDSMLASDGTGMLVDARTAHIREFKTMDAAHAAVRQVGFRIPFFLSGKST